MNMSRPVGVMLRNCEDTKLPIRACIVCHSERRGRYEDRTESHEQLFCMRTVNSRRSRVQW